MVMIAFKKKIISSSYSWSKYLKMPFSFDIHANVLIFGPGFVPYVHSLLASLVHIEISPFFHPEMLSPVSQWLLCTVQDTHLVLMGKTEQEDRILFFVATLQQQIAYRSQMRGTPDPSNILSSVSVLQPEVWQATALLELSSRELSLACKDYFWHHSSNQAAS